MPPARANVADLIYDVGAHLGEDSHFYLKLGYRVVAVEANPRLAAKLRNRFAAEMADGRLVLIEKAISQTAGEIDFFINRNLSVWGTASPKWAERNRRAGAPSDVVRVKAVPFAEVLREHGVPYYLKVDVEGADMLCVRALFELAERPDYISIESAQRRWQELVAEFDALQGLGYRRFKVVRQGRHKPGLFRTRTGEKLDYRFGEDSSGPFGPHLEGPWLTRRQALARYRWIFLRYRLISGDRLPGSLLRKLPLVCGIPDLAGWYDTHAAR
jgi:FkbM family methyltransferase